MTDLQLPAHLQGLAPSRIGEKLSQNIGLGAPPYLSLLGGRFTLIDAAGNEQPIATYDPKLGPYVECHIVDVSDVMSKIYYDKPFDPNAGQWEPPACWSDNGVAPSRNAARPQARSCTPDPTGQHGCKWNVWGSKISAQGSQVKACSDQYKIAIVVPPHRTAFLLRIPPNSLKNLGKYQERFKGQRVGIEHVITRMWYVSQGTLEFTAVSYVSAEQHALMLEIQQTHTTDALVGRTDVPIAAALPAPAVTPALTAPVEQQASGPFSAAVSSAPAVVTTLPPMTVAPAAATVPAAETPRRRGRKPAAPAPAAGVQPAQAPFPHPGAAPAQPSPFQPAPAPTATPPAAPAGNANFGIQAGVAPNAELQSTLANLFPQS